MAAETGRVSTHDSVAPGVELAAACKDEHAINDRSISLIFPASPGKQTSEIESAIARRVRVYVY